MAARVRKLEATKAKRATKREIIVVTTMISLLIGTSLFSDRTEFSVATARLAHLASEVLGQPFTDKQISRAVSQDCGPRLPSPN